MNREGKSPPYPGLDKYKRIIRYVFLLNERNLNQEIMTQGWCWRHRKYVAGNSALEKFEGRCNGFWGLIIFPVAE